MNYNLLIIQIGTMDFKSQFFGTFMIVRCKNIVEALGLPLTWRMVPLSS
jgi:hypothetical protein